MKNTCESKLGRCWRCFTLFSTPRHALSDREQPMHLISFCSILIDLSFFLCKRLGLIGRMSPSFGLWFSFCFHTSTNFDLRESHCFSHVCWISVLRIIFTCKNSLFSTSTYSTWLDWVSIVFHYNWLLLQCGWWYYSKVLWHFYAKQTQKWRTLVCSHFHHFQVSTNDWFDSWKLPSWLIDWRHSLANQSRAVCWWHIFGSTHLEIRSSRY